MSELSNALPYIMPADSVWEDVDEHRVLRWIEVAPPGLAADAVIFGAPFTSGNTQPTPSWKAPSAIRAAFADYTTYSIDFDVDLAELHVVDAGDVLVDATSASQSLHRIEDAVVALSAAYGGAIPIALGGDHSITAATVHGYARAHPGQRIGLVYFDAHTDVRAEQEGVALAGRPVRSIVETCDALAPSRIVEVGLHGFMNASRHCEWLREKGGHLVSAREVRRRGIDAVLTDAVEWAGADSDVIYVSVDLDVMRQVDAVGAAGRISPEGMDVVDLIEAVYALGQSGRVGMIDIVELDPKRDRDGTTTRVAATLVLSFLGGLVSSRKDTGSGFAGATASNANSPAARSAP